MSRALQGNQGNQTYTLGHQEFGNNDDNDDDWGQGRPNTTSEDSEDSGPSTYHTTSTQEGGEGVRLPSTDESLGETKSSLDWTNLIRVGDIRFSSSDDDVSKETHDDKNDNDNSGALCTKQPTPPGLCTKVTRKRMRDDTDDDNDDDDRDTITIKKARMTRMMDDYSDDDDDTSGDGHGNSPALRMAGVEQWRDMKISTKNVAKDGPLPDVVGKDLMEQTHLRQDQDQADARYACSRANESSPELVTAMDALVEGLTQCQLEDYTG